MSDFFRPSTLGLIGTKDWRNQEEALKEVASPYTGPSGVKIGGDRITIPPLTTYSPTVLPFADTRTEAEKAAAAEATSKEFEEKSTSIWNSIVNDPAWQKTKSELLAFQASNAQQAAQVQQQQQQSYENSVPSGNTAPTTSNNTIWYIVGGVVVVAGLVLALTMSGSDTTATTV